MWNIYESNKTFIRFCGAIKVLPLVKQVIRHRKSIIVQFLTAKVQPEWSLWLLGEDCLNQLLKPFLLKSSINVWIKAPVVLFSLFCMQWLTLYLSSRHCAHPSLVYVFLTFWSMLYWWSAGAEPWNISIASLEALQQRVDLNAGKHYRHIPTQQHKFSYDSCSQKKNMRIYGED